MIRISIEIPDRAKYRLRPLAYLRHRFWDDGIHVDWDLKNADLRIIDHESVASNLTSAQDRRLETPIIVDECTDGARVLGSVAVRSALAHPDVKVWLKRNTFRDFTLNNTPMVSDQYHYQVLNDLPEFHLEIDAPRCAMEITPEMAKKIQLLPTVGCDRFAFYRSQKIDWNAKRAIDVGFAGSVDYEVRDHDYWDGRLKSAREAIKGGVAFLPELHRRAAVLQLARLRHLRVVIGLNRSLQQDLYETMMMRTSISVSPWGFGEYAYRDYESILAGCVLVKPLSDHVETFAPDIYQAGRYYIPCRADFSDLPDIVDGIMSDRETAIDMARQAREDMLSTNTHEFVYNYYTHLFRLALGEDRCAEAETPQAGNAVMTLRRGAAKPARCRLTGGPAGRASPLSLSEDELDRTSHDVRLLSDALVTPGFYRLRFALRARGRKRAALQLHVDFSEQIWVHVDLESLKVVRVEEKGETLKVVEGPEAFRPGKGWFVGTLLIRVAGVVEKGLGLVVYAADESGQVYYTGDGRVSIDLAEVEFQRV